MLPAITPAEVRMRAAYSFFKAGSFTSWDTLFSEVAAFATQVGRDNLISISHSQDNNQAVVTVWYWDA